MAHSRSRRTLRVAGAAIFFETHCATTKFRPSPTGVKWEQISCFGPDGLLRRHDYTVDILGGAPGLNYATDYREVDGIIIPTTRRIYAWEGDYQLVPEPLVAGSCAPSNHTTTSAGSVRAGICNRAKCRTNHAAKMGPNAKLISSGR